MNTYQYVENEIFFTDILKNVVEMISGEQYFYVHLNHWLAKHKGQNIRVGQAKIVNFLDIKFGV